MGSTGQNVDIAAQLRSGLLQLGKQAGEALKDEKTQAAMMAAATAIGAQVLKKGAAGSKSASSGAAASSANKSGAGTNMMKGAANEAVMALLMTAGEKIITEKLGDITGGSSSGSKTNSGGKQPGLAKMGKAVTKELVEIVGKEEAQRLALKAVKYTAKNLMKGKK